MLVIVTYDVNTETSKGRKRLNKVAKCCLRYGQRVQNSVFECNVDASQSRMMMNELEALIDKKTDSLRFYNLGNNFQNRIIHLGAKASYDPEGIMIV